ncbi:FAD-dependent monooxygenase [uncultured Massilia sp.]|uniref:FAD-dependent monooxygenase n=1 Tax=uncultured Massilia sp. TaxID=169973 RepID=UPI0025F209E8|nr:FAD-dependent monooxygenase [uncultured Massilia sp.]
MPKPTILICGASIAGPATAFWLVRAGFDVTIVEQAAALRHAGNGVDIRAEALAVIDRMGLGAAVRARAAQTRGLRFVDRRDRERARIGTARLERMVGSEDVEIARGDLSALLHGATRDDVSYVFGDAVAALAQDGGGVDVTFRSGRRDRFDLVIGADGLHSGIRRMVFGPEERFVRFREHYFAAAAADLAIGEPGWTTFYNEPGRSAAVYRAAPGQGQLTFTFHSAQALAYHHRDTAAQRGLLRHAFAGMGWHVPAMLDAADAAADFYFDALAQVRMPSWTCGRVVLVGDAAWCASPASGAGALLALAGAYRLAGELAVDGISPQALARYEQAQRPLVKLKQSQLFTGITVPRTRAGILARNLFLSTPLTGVLSRWKSDDATPLRTYAFASTHVKSPE